MPRGQKPRPASTDRQTRSSSSRQRTIPEYNFSIRRRRSRSATKSPTPSSSSVSESCVLSSTTSTANTSGIGVQEESEVTSFADRSTTDESHPVMDARVQALESSLENLTQQLGELVNRLPPNPAQEEIAANNGVQEPPSGRNQERNEDQQDNAPAVHSNIIYTQKKGKLDFDIESVIKVLEELAKTNPSKRLKARDINEINAYLELARYYEHFTPETYSNVKQRLRMLLAVANHGWATALADKKEVVLEAADIEFSESALSAKNPYYKKNNFQRYGRGRSRGYYRGRGFGRGGSNQQSSTNTANSK